jgi:hypothetical protein
MAAECLMFAAQRPRKWSRKISTAYASQIPRNSRSEFWQAAKPSHFRVVLRVGDHFNSVGVVTFLGQTNATQADKGNLVKRDTQAADASVLCFRRWRQP